MTGTLAAEVRLPAIISDHMVLQRDHRNPIWGWDAPGTRVTVTLADQTLRAKADVNGRWEVRLAPFPAGGPHVLTVSGTSETQVKDVYFGEVWLCSGQSNMAWPLSRANNGDLERLVGDDPLLRLISVPQVGTQQPQDDFSGQWETATAKSTKDFSAVGYFFGKRLREILEVPVGLIDNAWGGSAAEAWVPRERLEASGQFDALLKGWDHRVRNFDYSALQAAYEQRLADWEHAAEAAKAAGKPVPRKPRRPRNILTGQHRPGNLFNGVLYPVVGYGLRGVIWYQGETNADRAQQYRELFPLLIQTWRDVWGQGDFPFYWVQLADFRAEVTEPADSAWAELREAQTLTLDRLHNTGQAVIIDSGEANDIHPRDKQTVADRLARIALARDYGKDIVHHSPRFRAMRLDGKRAVIAFHTGEATDNALDTFDTNTLKGFAIAGKDRRFVRATARITGPAEVTVWSDDVAEPVAVRYNWADNPIGNLHNRAGLPATPFRTDDWK